MGNCIAKSQGSSSKRESSKELKSIHDSQKGGQNQKESSSLSASSNGTTTVLKSSKTGSQVTLISGGQSLRGKNNKESKNKSKRIDIGKNTNDKNNGNGPKTEEDEKASIKKSQKLSTPQQRIEALFNKYKTISEDDEEVINSDGLEKFCKDLEIDPEDSVLLVLTYHLNCSELGLIHKQEFISGLEKLNLDSIVDIKKRIPQWKKELTDTNGSLKQIYKYVFKLGKADPQQKFISTEMAVGFLNLLLTKDFYHAKKFVEFLQTHESTYKTINQDQWTSLFEFIVTIKEDLSNYNENSAWPCMMDEYVEWLNPKEEEPEI
eukprot:TRINITY_DN11657_c0_g1_i1.p1 TRINITY_DN11657_c0_g1~~TRINITY_DN11657_c0_g1_i1.p1  ORF type:complete len:320 (-),score=92.13 TRINITY_DN11657_c0_g1_i1:76-1035(-)